MDNNYQKTFTCLFEKRFGILLFMIIFGGLFLRIFKLDFESLFMDEAISTIRAGWPIKELTRNLDYLMHSLWDGLLHFWIPLFGKSEFSIRFPSVLFGTLSIYLIYLVGVEIADIETGIISSAFLAISPTAIGFSQEARIYAIFLTLVLASTWCVIRLSRGLKPFLLVGYALLCFLSVWAHVFAAFILFVHDFYLLWLRYRREISTRSLLLITTAQVAILFPILIFLILPLILDYFSQTWTTWIPEPTVKILLGVLIRMGSGRIRTLIYLCLILSLFFLSIFSKLNHPLVQKIINWLKTKEANLNSSFLISSWIIIPVLFPFVLSFTGQSWFYWKYMSPVILALLLGAAYGLTRLGNICFRSVIFSLIIFLNVFALFSYYGNYYDSEEWRESVQAVRLEYQEGDVILLHSASILVPFEYYAEQDNFRIYTYPSIDIKSEQQLNETLSPYQRIWLVYSHGSIPEDELLSKLKGFAQSEYSIQFVGINLSLLHRIP